LPLLALGLVLCAASLTTDAQQFSVQAAVESSEVFQNEQFLFQIQVSGTDEPDKPDLAGLTDFAVEELGGRANNSSSVSIVNGRATRRVSRGYIFSYRLTPKRTGALIIPAIQVSVKGMRARTRAIPVTVRKPAETADFKLRVRLSKPECYVGEPVTLTVTWYIGKQPEGIEFNLPILKHPGLKIPEPDLSGVGPRTQVWELDGVRVVPNQGRGELGGKTYTTITFSLIVIPKQAGRLNVPPSTVACKVLTGYKNPQRRRQPGGFGGFFDDPFFGRGRQAVYRRIVVPSNPLILTVRELPAAGRPQNFAGHVGEYRIEVSATPTEVNVGDPITLAIKLAGPDYLEDVAPPPFHQQPEFVRNFKVPKEMAPGKVEGRAKLFTQTIRATHADVKEIPPVELPYFDTRRRQYGVAASQPIPLAVKATKVLTAQDAEGSGPVAAEGRKLAAWSRGIAHNYEDFDLIEDQRYGPETWLCSPAWISLLLGPPLAHLILLAAAATARKRSADPLAILSRKAYGEFRSRIKTAPREGQAAGDGQWCAAVLDAVQTYLGAKLRSASGALTFADVEAPLAGKGVDPETLQALKELFAQCEAGRYAGGAGSGADPEAVIRRAASVVKKMERVLR